MCYDEIEGQRSDAESSAANCARSLKKEYKVKPGTKPSQGLGLHSAKETSYADN
jgi:hypothetical protein